MEQKKSIWIVNYYAEPPQYVKNPRHIKIAEYLMNKGFDVTIFSASDFSNQTQYITNKKKYQEVVYNNLKYIHIKTLNYYNNSNVRSNFKRIISIYLFAIRFVFLSRKFNKPDLIYQNIHNPFDYIISICPKLYKCKYIVEAWDLWPAAMIKHGFIKANSIVAKYAYSREYSFYKKADSIILTMEGGPEYFQRHKWAKETGGKVNLSKLYNINNGVDLKEFSENIKLHPYFNDDLDNPELFKVVYIGSLGLANNVKAIIDAASHLLSYKDIKFFIIGNGKDRINLEEYCINNKITNVVFLEKYVPFNNIPAILSKSSLNLYNYRKVTVKMGMSSGKLFLYYASGRPICSNIEPKFNPVKEYNLGVSDTFKNSQEYANAILKIYNLPKQEYDAMCERVNNVAKLYDYPILCEKILNVINKTLKYE